MWSLSQRSNQTWGIKGYEVPKIDFDHVKHAESTENFLVASGKKKRAGAKPLDTTAERGGLFKLIERRANSVPPPWSYEQSLKWVQNSKETAPDQVPSKNYQKMKFQWKNTPKENQVYVAASKRKPGPVDTNSKKYSYIDHIIIQNTKENYPKPAPTDYFFDNKGVKKFRKDHEELYERKNDKEENRKDCLGLDN
jgi:hypothetical protein